ncbi:MAG: glycosyltransferase family 39 protein [Chloroflexi bacterium]|nr:glycosyltransferase family 39 protein [Chloroflexota bacterium]
MNRLPIILIIITAALLRLGWPGLTEFKADEARLYSLALSMAEYKSFALRGIGSSLGLPNFPLSVWLFSLPLFVWQHPYSATLFVAALNTLAVYACYRLTRRHWGEAAALVAALFFAVSPWAVIYSRKIWAQDLLPLFVLAYIGAALAAFVDKRRWALAMHLVALACVVQIHLSGLAFVPLTALWLIVFRRDVRWREVAVGVAAAALTALPFGIYLLGNMGNTAAVDGLLARKASIDLDSLRYSWMLLTGADIHSLAGPQAFGDFLRSVPNIDPVRWLWGVLAVAGLAVALYRRRPADLILVSWLAAPILFFIRHSTPVFPHYFIVTLPAGYMLAGIAVSTFADSFTAKARRAQRQETNGPSRSLRLRGLLISVLAASAAVQAGVWLALMFFVGRVATPNGFGTPLGMLLNVADQAKEWRLARGAPEILLVGKGDDPQVDEFAAVTDSLFHGLPHRFVDGAAAAVLPQGGAVVVIQSGDFTARGWYEKLAESATCLLLREHEIGIELLAVPPSFALQPAHAFAEPRLLANGVELLGWEAAPAWTVIWRVGYIPPAADYHFFNHAPSAQADGVGYPSRYWRDGDRVLSFFDLSPLAWPVRVGMYEFPSVTNVPVLDAMGNPYSDAVTAGP